MIIYRTQGPRTVPGWTSRVLCFERLSEMPPEVVEPNQPSWSEDRIEKSLLQTPSMLSRGLGLPTEDVLVLRQVARMDLYLRCNNDIHLIEVKGLLGLFPFKQSLTALKQVVRYWCKNAVWLRRRNTSVKLWSICPVRWRDGVPKVPKDWAADLIEIKGSQLQGECEADVGLAFYSVFQLPSNPLAVPPSPAGLREEEREFVFVMWRAEEPDPAVNFLTG